MAGPTELETSRSEWKIAYFHHPLYSSGARHGSEVDLHVLLEPLFLKHGVSVVFAGHEHFYERIRPQKGVCYFTEGGSAKLRRGNIQRTGLTAAGFDQDRSFMLVEVAGDELYFQTISSTGGTVDSGVIRRVSTTNTALGREAAARHRFEPSYWVIAAVIRATTVNPVRPVVVHRGQAAAEPKPSGPMV